MQEDRPDHGLSQPPASTRRGGHRLEYLLLFLAILLAGGLRLYELGRQDYWLDEIHTLTDSAGRRADFEALPHGVILTAVPRFTDLTPDTTWSSVWRGMESDSHPPVYFLFFESWRRLFGDGEFAARLPSVVFSVVSIVMVALIAGAYGRLRDGAWIALVLALTFSHIQMAQEARPYALAMMLVSISYWSLIRTEVAWPDLGRYPKVFWVAVYCLTTYLAVLTHYFAGFALLGQVAVVLVSGHQRLKRTWAIAVGIAIAAFALTWGRQVIAQLDFIASHIWLLEERSDHDFRTLLRMTDLPVRFLIAHARFRLDYAYSLIGLCLMAGSVVFLWRLRCKPAIVFAAWYFAPVLTLAAIDIFTQKQTLSHLRYVSVAAPGLVGMLVLTVVGLRRSLRWLSLASFVVAVALTLRLPTQDNPHNRLAASLIAQRLTVDSLLIYDAIDWPPFWVSQIYHNVAYYLPEFVTGPLPPCVLLRDRPSPTLATEIGQYTHVVVVSPRVDQIPNPLPDLYVPIDQTQYIKQIGFIYVFIAKSGDA